MAQLLETTMLICFGFSWPLNVYKNIKAKTAKSMSIQFILLITFGYVAGICGKIYTHTINYVLAVYLLNLAMVSLNIFVYFRNKRIDAISETERKTMQISYEETNKLLVEVDRYNKINKQAQKNGVVFFGGNRFKMTPFSELSQSGSITENIYNRSFCDLKLSDVTDGVIGTVAEICPKKIFINFGESEYQESINVNDFGESYRWALYNIHRNTDAKLYLVSILSTDERVKAYNSEIKAIAKETGCEYVDATDTLLSEEYDNELFLKLRGFMRTHAITFIEAMKS